MLHLRAVARFVTLSSITLLGMATLGCAGRPLPVSPGLSESTQSLPMVKIDRKSWDFGDYHVREIRRGWDKEGSVSVGSFSASKKSRKFSFSVAHADVSVQVACELTAKEMGVGNVTMGSGDQIACTLAPADGAAPWALTLHRLGSDRMAEGKLEQGGRTLQVVPDRGTGFMPPRGYVIREEGEVAAADVGRKTRTMWLPKQAPPGDGLALAGTAMTLMLLEEVS